MRCALYPTAWRPVILCTGAVVAGVCGLCPAGTYQTGSGPRARPHSLHILSGILTVNGLIHCATVTIGGDRQMYRVEIEGVAKERGQ